MQSYAVINSGTPLTVQEIACYTQFSLTYMIAFAGVLHSVPHQSQRSTNRTGRMICQVFVHYLHMQKINAKRWPGEPILEGAE